MIPLESSVESEGKLAISLGHQNRADRNIEDITRAMDRAVSCQSDGVIFPSGFLQLPFRNDVITRCRNRKLRIAHQVTTDSLSSDSAAEKLDELLSRLDDGDALNLVFGASALPRETLLARLTRWPEQVYFTYSVRSGDDAIGLLHQLQPYVRDRLFFHFPYHLSWGDGHLTCRQVFELTEKILTRVPGVQVRPLLGQELFDPRVDSSLELEPTHRPSLELRSNGGRDHENRMPIDVSVIIPSYNNRDYLLNTIRHLCRQDLARGRFEVIVVDDGSDDGTREALQSEMKLHEGEINFKYIFSPRLKPRAMGDANYRAGISRNLGVKNSSGRILCFLDSDILTPPDFLTDLLEKHRTFDVVQCRRLNLKKEKSDADIRFETIDPTNDTFKFEGDYWEKFYALQDWSSVSHFWKYTCTYGLSMPALLFKRVGWIRRGFVFYGFEDVELGSRLAKVGARFHLNKMTTYHLFHHDARSEFRNSDYLRQSLLAKTAQIFYLNRLEPEIFVHFRGLMTEQISILDRIPLILQKVGLRPRFERWFKPWQHRWLQIPVLATRNWRWFLWHNFNTVKRVSGNVAQKICGNIVKRVHKNIVPTLHSRLAHLYGRFFEGFHKVWGQKWKIRVLLLRSHGKALPIFFRMIYPLRKIYYFSSYQMNKRKRDLS